MSAKRFVTGAGTVGNGGAPLVRRLLASLLFVLSARTAAAQKPPQLGYVYPPVIVAGKSSDVQLGGYDFTVDLEWFVHDGRVRLEVLGPPGDYHVPPPPYWFGPRASLPAMPIPREVPGRIAVPADQPAGLVRWQVANANGSSSTAVFYVSRSHEIVEARSRDFPQRLPSLPVAVAGRLGRLTEVDRYELVADADGPISVDLMARRLGASFNGALQVRDEQDRVLADLADTLGVDGGLTFAAQAGRKYTLSVHDVDFRGDRAYVYRLAVWRGPRVACTLPAFGRRGATADVHFVGTGIVTGQPVLETVKQTVAFPADAGLHTFVYQLATPWGPVDVPIPLSDLDEIADMPTPNQPPAAQSPRALAGPAAVTRLMPRGSDEQRYVWQANKDESWSLLAESRGVGGSLDVAVRVLDPDGKVVAENDDLAGTTDAGVELRTATAGMFTCVVTRLNESHGMLDELYRLQLVRRTPDFALAVPQQVNLPSGGKVEVAIQVTRYAGFDGPIAITADGLPDGVKPDGDWTVPAGKNDLKAVLQAAADAGVVARTITFRGTATINSAMVSRPAVATAAGDLCPRRPADQQIPQVLLAMTMPAPFEVHVVDRERQRDVPRGTTYLAELEIERKSGFAGEIHLEMTAQQDRYRQGKRGPIVRVPPAATQAFYPCFMPEWLGTDLTQRIVIHGVAGVPDPKGRVRYLTRPGDARITMIMEGALLKLSTPARELTPRVGQAFDVPVTVARSAKLPLPTTVRLIVPEEVADLIQVEPLLLPPGTDQGTLHVTTRPDARLSGPWSFTVTATALQDGQWPVVSETDVNVVFTGP